MDEGRKAAYRFLLAAALLHVKWDLACFLGGPAWFRPRRLLRQLQQSRTAALRAYCFHNLAISAAHDFYGFSETRFWEDVDAFQRDCPGNRYSYRTAFERLLRGESVEIIAPKAP